VSGEYRTFTSDRTMNRSTVAMGIGSRGLGGAVAPLDFYTWYMCSR